MSDDLPIYRFDSSPAFERTAAEAQFSVIGDELRKLGEGIAFIQGFSKGFVDSCGAILERIEANQQVILQKLEQWKGDTDKGRETLQRLQTNFTDQISALQSQISIVLGALMGQTSVRQARRRRKSKHKGRAR